MKTLLIDNYDSFTYNLFQLVSIINGEEPIVIKNNEMTWDQIKKIPFDNIILSPGPGHPDNSSDFGICSKILIDAKVPILGICLGHQGFYSAYGGKVTHAPMPMHGRISEIFHQGDPLFNRIPSPFKAVRYHSLIAAWPCPPDLTVIASSCDTLIMGLKHNTLPIWSVQFHPESIATEVGYKILSNFKDITNLHRKHPPRTLVPTLKTKPISKSFQFKILTKEINTFYHPEKIFQSLYSPSTPAIWLDSSKNDDEFSRYSIIGMSDGPLSYRVEYDLSQEMIVIHRGTHSQTLRKSIFDFLKEELKHYQVAPTPNACHFNLGFVGYFGYELKSETAGVKNKYTSQQPDAQFLFLDRALVFDHVEKKTILLQLVEVHADEDEHPWFSEIIQILKTSNANSVEPFMRNISKLAKPHLLTNRQSYLHSIKQCQEYIKDGESYEICLTNKIILNGEIDPLSYYLKLRETNPAPFAAFLNFKDFTITSSSPEQFLHINSDNLVTTKPMKGTLARGKAPLQDLQQQKTLKEDEKFQSENLMIVDLLRNDLGKVCEIGSVSVPNLMQVETYETVHQLVSTVTGKLRQDLNAVDCIKAIFPGGSMTGAPKIRTLEILDRLETQARGIYSGALGTLSLNGTANFSMVIRTAIITKNQLSVGIGGAIIAMSDPEEEFSETLLKAKALLSALESQPLPAEME